VLRRLHCPWLILELMLLIYRAIFVLLDISDAIQTSQNCRLGNRNIRSKLSCMGQMLSVLLVRAMRRSSALYDSMESRLYDGQIRVLEDTNPATSVEWLGCGLWLIALCVLGIFG
ncbi:MAG: energy-coupling factor transporter transmembrane component T, partial [Negativibacillus sp.]|nr:energy-coupling factor transporter transmembrane component T [Negativibacillus sp.]